MDIKELMHSTPDLKELIDNLKACCERHGITKFEPDEIVELISDGEDPDWIIDQLTLDKAGQAANELQVILTEIGKFIAPANDEDGSQQVSLDEPEAESEAIAIERPEAVDGSVEQHTTESDISQFDLSQLGDMSMLSDMKLPAGVDINQIQKIMQTPQGAAMLDFSLYCQEQGIDDIENVFSDSKRIKELSEQWQETPRPTLKGKKPLEEFGANPLMTLQKPETYRREQPRVGRNDPCPCGSGKKYKKCCGRNE